MKISEQIKLKLLALIIIFWGPITALYCQTKSPEIRKDVHLCIKFRDDLPVYVRDGKLTDGGFGIVESLGTLQNAGIFEKTVTCVSESRLDSMRIQAQAYWNSVERQNIGIVAGTIADMNNYFTLRLKPELDPKEVETRFDANSFVEYSEVLPDAEKAEPPVPPNFVPQQNYLNSSSGINAEQVYSTYNNRGAGIQIVDIETAFNPNHQDLPSIPLVGNNTMDFTFGTNHGTSVLGQIVSKNNGWGTTGIASESNAKFAPRGNSSNYSNVIIAAASSILPGDVILLELQLTGPTGLVPIEYYKYNYDAIKLVTGNNRVVVEAAGNGGVNLDTDIIQRGNQNHYPFLNAHNSGAIIVGAGYNSQGSTPRKRMDYSNYGSRVNVQGFGENIVTTGGDIDYVNNVQTSIPPSFYAAEGENYWYTNEFGGTSGASPIVTGACLLIQSVLKNTSNTYLTSFQMQQLMMATGKPQQGNTSENIGPMPDVFNAIQTLLSNSNNCNPPSASQLLITNLTATSATLQCTATNVQAFKWAYRRVGSNSWLQLPETSTGFSQVSGLLPNKQYEFVVKTRCNATTWSSWSASRTFTTNVAASCAAPTSSQLSVSNITAVSATLNCTLTGMQSYDWNVRVAGASAWTSLAETTTGVKNITGLQAGGNYEYRVRVRCNTGTWSDWSAVRNFTTSSNTTCTSPSSTQIWASQITFTSARLNCSVSGVLAYDWRVRLPGGAWTDLDETTSGNYDLFNMNSGTTWEFSVKVKCSSSIWSDWSPGKIFTTTSCTTPTAGQLSVTNITYSSATLNCSLQGVLYYDWAYRVNGGTWVNLDYTITGITNIDNLSAGTTYQFAVAVSCDGNTWSNWVYKTFNTPACSAPAGSQIWWSELQNNSVIINCSKTGVQQYNYAISYIPGIWYTFETSYNSVEWSNLQPSTWHYYAVQVSCDGSTWSDWSPTESFYNSFTSSEVRDSGPVASLSPDSYISTDIIGNVYPNPSNDGAIVEISQANRDDIKWELCDQFGRLIRENREPGVTGLKQIMIQTADLPSGIYTLKIQTATATNTQQLSVFH